MIQTDRELEWKIARINDEIRNLKTKNYIYNILRKTTPIFLLIIYILSIGGLTLHIQNLSLLSILSIFNLIYLFFLGFISYIYFEDKLNLSIIRLSDLKKEKENVFNFITYLTAVRHIESLKLGKNLYPELLECDSNSIINKFKDLYEEKRIQYEIKHENRLKLNRK